MNSIVKVFLMIALVSGLTAPKAVAAGKIQNTNNKTTIWPVIPFFPLGDLGQYEKTMSQDRDQVRQMFWGELMGSLEKMADRGAPVEDMLEPMANILMMFDQVHDSHKATDVFLIDKSLEAQFKATLDSLFRTFDVREGLRQVEISQGLQQTQMQTYVQKLAKEKRLGQSVTRQDLDSTASKNIFEQIDVVAFGTFSSLGRGQFQVTLQLTGNKNGITRSFIATGPLTAAVNDLAKQVFDFFQMNVYPDWETSQKQLQWLPMPVNLNKEAGYTWEEARQYCRSRGYRLPFAREMLMAESGGAYKQGGIASMKIRTAYAVADKRAANDNYVLLAGREDITGGPIQGASYSMSKGQFWCVKGKASADVQIFETVWELLRQHRKDREMFRALETVRYELGDFGTDVGIYWGPSMTSLERMGSLNEALDYLKTRGVNLVIPASLL